MFAFLIALGIVVDDAIVIGENIFEHRQQGKDFLDAAVDGAYEVLPSVAASVTTTIIAFTPMLYVTGVMGKFFAVLPMAIISMLVISLVESMFILPCHLAHEKIGVIKKTRAFANRLPPPLYWTLGVAVMGVVFLAAAMLYPVARLGDVFGWINGLSHRFLNWIAERLYLPSLRAALSFPGMVIASAAAILLLSIGAVKSGIVPREFFPKLDANTIQAQIIFPDGTPSRVVDEATKRLEAVMIEIDAAGRAEGEPISQLTRRQLGSLSSGGPMGANGQISGSHVGSVRVELVDTSTRQVTSQSLVNEWREKAGEFPGADSLTFGSVSMGPAGKKIEFKLLAAENQMDQLEEVSRRCKEKLNTYLGVFDVDDDSRPGKWEFQLKVKKQALAMGVTAADLAETVRASYYGEEVMRLQRGRHEVKLMVRYPSEERRSLEDFEEVHVRLDDDAERPLTELADVRVERGFSEINRVNQMRSITVSADVNEAKGSTIDVVADFKGEFLSQLAEDFPDVLIRWEGEQEQRAESMGSLMVGFAFALLAMYALLTV
ncbi:MAG: efflux RND transporter permease subunit, partial [Planctomycetales bacterium]